jgi:methionyl-tRNA formyltransferase
MTRQGYRLMPFESEFRPRVLFLGMQNRMSQQALKALLDNNVEVCAVVLSTNVGLNVDFSAYSSTIDQPNPVSELPLVNPFMNEGILQTVSLRRIPIVPIAKNDTEKLTHAVSRYKPDIACVACFPHRLSKQVLNSVEHGFINFHPSLLPHHKGPAPLFWVFRSVTQQASGVTVHIIDEGLDTGDIVLQQRIEFPSGMSGLAAEELCSEIGGALLARAAVGLSSGSLEPSRQPPGGNYDPWPDKSDFRLSTSWSAFRAYNFMKGTSHWNHSYSVVVDGEMLELSEAIACKTDLWSSEDVVPHDDSVFVRFDQGTIAARLA